MIDRLLVVAAHPDDEVLGAGGTMHKIASMGGIVSVVIMVENHTRHRRPFTEAAGEFSNVCKRLGVRNGALENFPDQALDSVKFIDVVQVIEDKIQALQPTLIITHTANDLNRDHVITSEAVRVASRSHVCNADLWEFQTVTNGIPLNGRNEANLFVELNDANVQAKIDAMLMYVSEQQGPPSARSPEFIENWLRVNGMVVNKDFAEPFKVIRITAS